MSRTIKDLPFWYWQAELCRTPYPPDNHPWRHNNGLTVDAIDRLYHLHPAHGWREKLNRLDRRDRWQRYRSYQRAVLAHERWDDIEPPRHLTGWHY